MSRKIVVFLIWALSIQNVENIEKLSCKFSKVKATLDKLEPYKCVLQQQDKLPEFHAKNIPQISNDQVTAVIASSGIILTHFTRKICETYPNVLEIDFRDANVEVVDENSFENCKHLAFLMLSDNKIVELPQNLFKMNQNLEKLLIKNILINSVPKNLLKNQQKSLKILHLTSKLSFKIPENFFSFFENLEDLWIGNVKNFNFEWIKNLKRLKILSITSCQIEKIPQQTFSNLQNLENLRLSENNLLTICAESFGNLPNLKHINFSFNNITAIDEALIDNTGVVSMDMTGNSCANGMLEDIGEEKKDRLKKMLKKCFENYHGCQ